MVEKAAPDLMNTLAPWLTLAYLLGLVVMSVRLWGILLMFGLVLWWRWQLDSPLTPSSSRAEVEGD